MKKPEQYKDTPCIKIVNENLQLVEEGKALNHPLSYLNRSCNFKKGYKFLCDLKYGKVRKLFTEEQKKKVREYHKKYYQRPEVKKRAREHYYKPKVKKKRGEYQRAYDQRPEVKKRKKEYYQRPEVKERRRERERQRYQKKKNERK